MGVGDVAGERGACAADLRGRLFDRDPERVDDEFATPGHRIVNPPGTVEPGIRRGPTEVVEALRNSSELFDSSRHELHELFDRGDAVVAAVSFSARSCRSGIELVRGEAHTWTLRDGRIVRFAWGRDVAAAA